MKRFKRLVPLIVFILATPIAFALGIGSAIEGDFFYTKLVFPYAAVLVAVIHSYLPSLYNYLFYWVFLGLSLVQFAIYGVIFTVVDDRPPVIVKLGAIHVVFSIVAFTVGYFVGM